MKVFVFLIQFICLCSIGSAQFSNYYKVDQNINVSGTVNKNINVSGTVRNTVTTIDYGALAQANALRESNRITQQNLALEQARYRDEKERNEAILYAQRALEIASAPLKAHQYGTYFNSYYEASVDGYEWIKNNGLLSFTSGFTVPHPSLFENIGTGRFENISYDGITTEIIRAGPQCNYNDLPELSRDQVEEREDWIIRLSIYYNTHNKPRRKDYKQNKEQYTIDLERYLEVCDSLDNWEYRRAFDDIVRNTASSEGNMFLSSTSQSGDSSYLHKKELVRRTVFGISGFRSTLIWEDEFEICITDNYFSQNQEGIIFSGKVRYKADSNSGITFEELEGRRFYLIKFCDKFHAASEVNNIVTRPPDRYKPKRRSYSSSGAYYGALDKSNAN